MQLVKAFCDNKKRFWLVLQDQALVTDRRRGSIARAACNAFVHRVRGDVAHRDIAALGDQLTREFAAHARAAPGDNGDLSGKILHGGADLSFLSGAWGPLEALT